MDKENRRVRMTKQLLQASFLEQLEQKPLARITVKDICTGADVNRSTYYVYFSDPYDQMDKLMQQLLQELDEYVSRFRVSQAADEMQLQALLTQLLNYHRDKKDVFRILLGKHGVGHLEYDVLQLFEKHFLTAHPEWELLPASQLTDLIFVASGCTGLITRWILSDCPEKPETLAAQIIRLTRAIRAAELAG